MKAVMYYFSGTGNTKKIVNSYREEFLKNGWEIDIFKIEDNIIVNTELYDLIGIAYPIHAFNATSIILDFAKKLNNVNNQKLFIIKTSGEPLKINNISSLKLVGVLKKKGYMLKNEYHYVMPYNIIFRHSNAMAYHMWDTAQKLIPIDCNEIINGKEVKLKKVFLGRFLAWIFRIEHFGGRLNGKYYKVQNTNTPGACIHCNQCINNCPVNNIKYENDEFIFGNNCLMCMRCSMNCPVDAISIGLFNKWKVNGQYNFNDKDNDKQLKHRNWCKTSYQRYFKRCKDKIEKYQKNNRFRL